MKRATVITLLALLLSAAGVTTAPAQQRYTYEETRTRTRTVLIDWRPGEKTHQRYTVSVSPLRLASHGLKFDFERELPRPGHWLGTSLVVYLAPPRNMRYLYWDHEGNNRASFNSGFDDYHRMWGVGTSVMFKNIFSRRGWYFSTGIVFDFFRVGVMESNYIPYVENGLTFYDYGETLETKSYFKPSAQINIGKHFAISRRCYFDLYAGIGISYALYKNDGRHSYGQDHDWYHPRFSELGGFAYRGLYPVGGFRFGVLLWDRGE